VLVPITHAPRTHRRSARLLGGAARPAALPFRRFVITAEAFRVSPAQQRRSAENDGAALEPSDVSGRTSWLAIGVVGSCARSECPCVARPHGEDGAGASFAGQHLTVLNVRDKDGVLDSILACWASLYSATALHYRTAKDMVAPVGCRRAGAHSMTRPASRSLIRWACDVVVIESAWGLGEGVVSGIVTPDHAVVRKADGAIVRHDVSTKERRVVPAPDGGTSIEELSGDLARQAVLSD
jgi:hypothetical protein